MHNDLDIDAARQYCRHQAQTVIEPACSVTVLVANALHVQVFATAIRALWSTCFVSSATVQGTSDWRCTWASPPTPPPVNPGQDENNIGNKLLKMMGWKEGQGLGTSGDGRVDPMCVLSSRYCFFVADLVLS